MKIGVKVMALLNFMQKLATMANKIKVKRELIVEDLVRRAVSMYCAKIGNLSHIMYTASTRL